MADPHALTRARTALRAYLDQWRMLTDIESEAVHGNRWNEVEQLQRTKEQLQGFISGALNELREQARQSGLAPEAELERFRTQVDDLVQREAANGQSVAAKLQQAGRLRRELESATQQLRQVRQAYVPAVPAMWESFS